MGGEPLPATPGALATGAPPPPAAPFALPAGEPADPATAAAITATIYGTLACQNAGNWLAVFTFYTDDFLHKLRAEAAITPQDIAAWRKATLEPRAPEEYPALLGVREARVLPDGRVGTLVESDFAEGLEVDFLYFERQAGRWLLDDAVFALEEQYPAISATPTP